MRLTLRTAAVPALAPPAAVANKGTGVLWPAALLRHSTGGLVACRDASGLKVSSNDAEARRAAIPSWLQRGWLLERLSLEGRR